MCLNSLSTSIDASSLILPYDHVWNELLLFFNSSPISSAVHSFVLSASDLWIKSPKQLRNTITISPFKQHLYNYISQRVDVPHIAIIAILNVTPTVYQIQISGKSVTKFKKSKNYFLRCNMFVYLFTAVRTVHPINAHRLLYSNSQLSSELNIMIVDAVHKYIKST